MVKLPGVVDSVPVGFALEFDEVLIRIVVRHYDL